MLEDAYFFFSVFYSEPYCHGIVEGANILLNEQEECPYGEQGSMCITAFGLNDQVYCSMPSFLINATTAPAAPTGIPTVPPPAGGSFDASSPFILVRSYDSANCSNPDTMIVQQIGKCTNSGIVSTRYDLNEDGSVTGYTCISDDCSGVYLPTYGLIFFKIYILYFS